MLGKCFGAQGPKPSKYANGDGAVAVTPGKERGQPPPDEVDFVQQAVGCPKAHVNGNGLQEGSLSVASQIAAAQQSVSRCPFGHGSVGAGPFPGYVHGKHPEICSHGCKPDPLLGKEGRAGETPLQTLVREALEYQELYHREKGNSEQVKQERVASILAEIEATGTYTHTFDELQHGARVAWRNAPKCSNRKFWEELMLMDYRHANTPEEMFLACLDLLETATLSCVTTANIVVFRPQTPGTKDGPRVWNSQLLRFAGYKRADGSIYGEKAEAAFTQMLQDAFGWKPPAEEKQTRFDILPLVLQAHPDEEPKVFKIPPQYVARVPISHPDNPGFAELGLQWYAVPAVSCLDLAVGGLTYTACPFNGWYSVTEIVRNLSEEGRYDMCMPVAQKFGWDTRTETTMWRDAAIVAITQAVMYSFRQAGYGMVDHHTLMKNFWGWYNKERARRGYSPGNWKWIIPPISPTASRCYLELNHMTEYTIKPNYWYAPMWRAYLQRLMQVRQQQAALPAAPAEAEGGVTAHAQTKEAATAAQDADGDKGKAAAERTRVIIAYASVTGTTAKYADAVGAVLGRTLAVTVLNMEDFEPDSWSEKLSAAKAVLLMTSTYGPGAPPSTAAKFMAWVQKGLAVGGESVEALGGQPYCVVGFGCTSYPRFCAAADQLNALIAATGATPLLPVTKVDSLSHEEVSVWSWCRSVLAMMRNRDIISQGVQEAAAGHIPITTDGKPKPFVPLYTLIDLTGVEGVRPARDRFRTEASIVEVRDLLKPSDKADAVAADELAPATKQVVLDTSAAGSSLSYLAGDELAVWGENPPDAVKAVAQALGISDERLDSMFLLQRSDAAQGGGDDDDGGEDDGSGLASMPFPLPNTYRTIFTQYVALCDTPSYEAVRALAGYAPADDRLAKLAASYGAYQAWLNASAVRWCDMFKEFPALAGLPVAVFLQLVPVIKSRHYSISSSSYHQPGQLHLTISRLAYRLPTGAARSGFCSTFLASRKPGDRVSVKVLFTPGFRMPLDPAAPVIMVAAGTGIAPFKGFWEERLARHRAIQEDDNEVKQELGPGVLIFGCRNSTEDFLYCNTIQDVVASGALSKVMMAFSREPHVRKQYVQDVVAAHAEELAPIMRNKACHIYVCGSSNMAQEVAVAFGKVVGAAEFSALVQAGRYHEDVFGMVVPNRAQAVKEAAQQGTLSMLATATPKEVSELLEKGDLHLDTVDPSGGTMLHIATRAGNGPLVQFLLDKGVPLNVLDTYGCTALQLAKLNGLEALERVIEAAGGKLMSRMVELYYPLHAAVMCNDVDALRQAIARGADLGATEYHGLTPLHVACAVAGPDVIKVLLDAGAPLDVMSRRGLLPLQLALALQRSEAAQLLRAAGAPLVVKQVVTVQQPGSKAGPAHTAWDPNSAASLKAISGMTEEEIAALQGSWAYLSGSSFPANMRETLETFGIDFFLCLFEQCPTLLSLFPFKDEQGKPILSELKVHGLKVISTLGVVVSLFANFDVLSRTCVDLVQRHIKYGVELAHYGIVFNALMTTLTTVMGEKLDATAKSAWGKVGAILVAVATSVYAAEEEKAAKEAEAAEGAPSKP